MDTGVHGRAYAVALFTALLVMGCATTKDAAIPSAQEQSRTTNEMWMKSYPDAGITPEMGTAEATDRMQRAEKASYKEVFKSVIPSGKPAKP